MPQRKKVAFRQHDSNQNEESLERIKHPLENSWSFWMYTNQKANSWEENLVKLTTFDTVEDYWCLYHHMKRPSELELCQEYAIFKNNIRPMWEDAANRAGGRWLINFEDRGTAAIDTIWLSVVLLAIGENFKESNDICGVVVQIRVKCKIAVWLKNAKNNKAVLDTGRKLKEVLGGHGKINFHKHQVNHNMFTL